MWRAWLVVAMVLAGCGSSGGDSDRAQIAHTVHEYLNALADKDPSAACDALSVTARHDITTMNGGGSCKAAATTLIAHVPAGARPRLRSARVLDEKIQGTKATAKLKGAVNAAHEMPLVKEGDRWKIAGFEGDVHFTSQADALCVTGMMQNYDAHSAPDFWYRNGRNVYRDYVAEFCRRADQRGLLRKHVKAAQLDPISRQVIREMKRRGEIRGA